ncbi:MAG: 1,4-alpha-glucan branching protein domain-containing protein [Spirochaetia bacterium]
MPRGYLILMLHAHLPYVRHPEHESFLEENWLFEAISETYLPLLRVMDRLEADGVPFKLTFSISPTLSGMLQDELLQVRYVAHLEKMLELAEKELHRTKNDPELYRLAQLYNELYTQNHLDFTEKYSYNILSGFDYYYKRGRVELLTTAATHPFLPLYESYPQLIDAEVSIAVQSHKETFGKYPKGFWFPEAGYYPGFEEHLANNGLQYFFAATHGVLFAYNKPPAGVYLPVSCPNGLSVFGRDIYSTNAVWSPEEGYPGDHTYREFFRDIGYDLPIDYIGPYIHDDRVRIPTGFKYHAVTGNTDDKRIYDPAEARRTVQKHADNFLYRQLRLIDRLGSFMDEPPVISSPFDAELFGHWWFEGPDWIEALARSIHKSGEELVMTTPSEYLKHNSIEKHTVQPAFSSWGTNGYAEVWLDGSNDWVYPHTHKAVERMTELVRRFPDESGLKERALNQAAREVLLAVQSDWPFIMRSDTTVSYAVRRVKEHIYNFTSIYESLRRGAIGTEWLTSLERKNNIFPNIDYRVFAPSSKRHTPHKVPVTKK